MMPDKPAKEEDLPKKIVELSTELGRALDDMTIDISTINVLNMKLRNHLGTVLRNGTAIQMPCGEAITGLEKKAGSQQNEGRYLIGVAKALAKQSTS